MRQKKRGFRLILLLMAGVAFFFVYGWKERIVPYVQTEAEVEGEAVSRCFVAKTLALLLENWEGCLAKENRFAEEEKGIWYVKYANTLYDAGLWLEEETPPQAAVMEGNYTYGELKAMLQRVEAEIGEPWQMKWSEVSDQSEVSPETWREIWDVLREQWDKNGQVVQKQAQIYGTPEQLPALEAWMAATGEGIYGFEGLDLAKYVDCELSFWFRDGEILFVEKCLSDRVCYENVLITAWEEAEGGSLLEIFFEGVSKSYFLNSRGAKVHGNGALADVTVEGGQVVRVDLKRESIAGKVLAVNEGALELEGYGEVPFAESLRVFQTYGELAELDLQEVRLGEGGQRFMVAEGKICGVLLEQAFQAEHIRVLLKTTGFASLFHETVAVRGTGPFYVQRGKETVYYEAGDVVSWNAGDAFLTKGRVVLRPEEGSKLQVLSHERSVGNPEYEGTLELMATEEGILLVNEVLLETYLTGVLSSEMPASYGKEALKAQAVCARSYGYRQMAGNAYRAYGAHVDDSTTFQVYNNGRISEAAKEAVGETYGQVLTHKGEVIGTYYFSTSCGHTTDGTVWGGSAAAYPYLTGRWLQTSEPVELRQEEAFRAFIRNTDGTAYEAQAPWYRWNVTVSLEALEKQVREYLAKQGKTPKDTLLIKQADGSFRPGTIEDIGSFHCMEICERGVGGIASVLEIKGSKGTVRFLRQSTIRSVLGDPAHVYERNGDTYVGNLEVLPSAYISPEPLYEGEFLVGYRIYGGGNGHGVGLSQSAAGSLARIGRNYREILDAFYTDCLLARIY